MNPFIEYLDRRTLLSANVSKEGDHNHNSAEYNPLCDLFTPSNNLFWIEVAADLTAGIFGGWVGARVLKEPYAFWLGSTTGLMSSMSLLISTTPVENLNICASIAKQNSDLITVAYNAANYAIANTVIFVALLKMIDVGELAQANLNADR